MKKIYLGFVLFTFFIITVLSQTPQAIKYQAIARDDVGNIIAEQDVSLRISILEGNASGPIVYSETHIVHTNLLGLLNIEIGNGTVVSGNFPSINWGSNIFFIKTEMDPAGGTSYVFMGTSQLLSVPYSLFSENTANVDDADANPTNEIQTLSKSGSTIELSDGGGSVNDDVDDADNNPANELQTLSKSGTNVTLSDGGGTVSIIDNDNDATNELQTISKSGSTITLSNSGGSFTDAVDDADNNPTNEIQNISKSGSTVTLSNGGGSFTDDVNDADNNPTNELQSLSIIGNNLSINPGGSSVTLPTGLPSGSLGKTLYHNGSNWVSGNNLYNAGGNVGIGTINPSYKLHVVDPGGTAIYAYSKNSSDATIHALNTEGCGIYAEHSDPLYTAPAIWAKNTGYGTGILAETFGSPQPAVHGIAHTNSGANYAIRGKTYSSSGFAGYFEGGKNYFEGNVGMGTINPSYKLHVVDPGGTAI
ncbi:MAG: hypothetical protein K8R46_11460, partial [Pirellulales bacterium]|nr:hypothetical protein [Pirellulales bacterium]